MSSCALCGGPNACAMASEGVNGAECWCQHVTFTRDVLERIPLADRGRVCVCRDCVALIAAERVAPSSPIGDRGRLARPGDAGEAHAEMLRKMLSKFEPQKLAGEEMADDPVGKEAFAHPASPDSS